MIEANEDSYVKIGITGIRIHGFIFHADPEGGTTDAIDEAIVWAKGQIDRRLKELRPDA